MSEITIKIKYTPGDHFTLSQTLKGCVMSVEFDAYSSDGAEAYVNGRRVEGMNASEYQLSSSILDYGLGSIPPVVLNNTMNALYIDLGSSVYSGVLNAMMSPVVKGSILDVVKEGVNDGMFPILEELKKVATLLSEKEKDDVSKDSGVSVVSELKDVPKYALTNYPSNYNQELTDAKFTAILGTGKNELPAGTMVGNLPEYLELKLDEVSKLNTTALRFDRVRRNGVEYCSIKSTIRGERMFSGGLEHICDVIFEVSTGIVQFTQIYYHEYFTGKKHPEYALIVKTVVKPNGYDTPLNLCMVLVATLEYSKLPFDSRFNWMSFNYERVKTTVNYQHALENNIPYFIKWVRGHNPCCISIPFPDTHWLEELAREMLDYPKYTIADGKSDCLMYNTRRILEGTVGESILFEAMPSLISWISYKTMHPDASLREYFTGPEYLNNYPVLEFESLISELFQKFLVTSTSPKMLSVYHALKMRQDRNVRTSGKIRFGNVDSTVVHFCPCCGSGFSNILMTQICNDLDHVCDNYFAIRRDDSELISYCFGTWKATNYSDKAYWPAVDGALNLNNTVWKNIYLSLKGKRLLLQ